MNYSPFFRTAFAACLLALAASPVWSAPITAVSYGGDYVSANTANARTWGNWSSLGGSDIQRTVTFSLTSSLNPASGPGYTGPTFYGGATAVQIGSITEQSANYQSRITNTVPLDRLQIQSGGRDASSTSGWAANTVIFLKQDFTGGLSSQTISLGTGSSLSFTYAGSASGMSSASCNGRLLIRDGLTWYISQDNLSPTTNTDTSLTLDPTAVNWAVFTLESSVGVLANFDQGSATFSSHSFTDVTAVGFYGERDTVGTNSPTGGSLECSTASISRWFPSRLPQPFCWAVWAGCLPSAAAAPTALEYHLIV